MLGFGGASRGKLTSDLVTRDLWTAGLCVLVLYCHMETYRLRLWRSLASQTLYTVGFGRLFLVVTSGRFVKSLSVLLHCSGLGM